MEIGRHDLSVINDNQLRDHFSMKINDESSLAGQHKWSFLSDMCFRLRGNIGHAQTE